MAGRLRQKPLPRQWLFTDPVRTPDPVAIAKRLPRGTGVVYRHFGAADRLAVGRALGTVARRRGLLFLVGADPALARTLRADGVHWPERLMHKARRRGIDTAAVHGQAALRRAARLPLRAVFLSPIARSDSPSAGAALGLERAGRWAKGSVHPVVALGGVGPRDARAMRRAGFAGWAGIAAWVNDPGGT
jgi:thiamine-phosphate pyrophosphorylase